MGPGAAARTPLPSCWESYPLPPTAGQIPLLLFHSPLFFLPAQLHGGTPASSALCEKGSLGVAGGCQSPPVCHLRQAQGPLRAAQWPDVFSAGGLTATVHVGPGPGVLAGPALPAAAGSQVSGAASAPGSLTAPLAILLPTSWLVLPGPPAMENSVSASAVCTRL